MEYYIINIRHTSTHTGTVNISFIIIKILSSFIHECSLFPSNIPSFSCKILYLYEGKKIIKKLHLRATPMSCSCKSKSIKYFLTEQ